MPAKAAAEANRATNGDVAKLAERVDANTRAIGEMKAQIAAATPNAEEQQLRRDLMNAMSAASQFRRQSLNSCRRRPHARWQRTGWTIGARALCRRWLAAACHRTGTIAAYFRAEAAVARTRASA